MHVFLEIVFVYIVLYTLYFKNKSFSVNRLFHFKKFSLSQNNSDSMITSVQSYKRPRKTIKFL